MTLGKFSLFQASSDVDVGVKSLRGQGTRQPAIAAGRNTGPKLIIYVMGSLSYAEMRCAHNVSKVVIIGISSLIQWIS